MLREVKFASCLEDLLTFRRLLAYKLKVSCITANQLLRAYALFSRFDEQENSGVSASEPMLSGAHDETWGYGNLLMPPCLSDPKGVSRRFSRDMRSAAFDVKIQMGNHNYYVTLALSAETNERGDGRGAMAPYIY